MTTPTQGNAPTGRAGNRVLGGATALLVAAVAVYAASHGGPSTPPAPVAACPAGQRMVTMRAQDTAVAEVVGDTLFVQRTDTLLAVDSVSHQAFAVTLDSGATVQMAAVCAPVDSAFRIRIVPQLPTGAPTPGQVAYAVLAGRGATMVPP